MVSADVGQTNALHDVYFFDATQGVAVGELGLILRTTDGGAGWQGVTSGVKDGLRRSRLVELMELPAAIRKTSSIQPIQDLRGRSVKADFLDLHYLARIC